MTIAAQAAAHVRQAVPFFRVHDIARSLRFYVDGLGFAMTKEWRDEGALRWCRLERGDAALMLQEFWRDGPHRNAPGTAVGVGVTICFMVDEAIALWRELESRGLPARRPFVGNGMWVTELTDPDGYHLLFESPADAPEESVFGEDR